MVSALGPEEMELPGSGIFFSASETIQDIPDLRIAFARIDWASIPAFEAKLTVDPDALWVGLSDINREISKVYRYNLRIHRWGKGP